MHNLLTSWQIGLGLQAIPDSVLEKTRKAPEPEPKNPRKKVVRLSSEQREAAKEFITPLVLKGTEQTFIHEALVSSAFGNADDDDTISLSLTRILISEIKAKLGIPKYSQLTEKIVKLYISGLGPNEICERTGKDKQYIHNVLNRKRRKGLIK